MLRQETCISFKCFQDDPVRTSLTPEFRLSEGREVYSYLYKNEVASVICIAYTSEIPRTVIDLDGFSIYPDTGRIGIAVPYSVWSYKKGFGRSILLAAREHIKQTYPGISRIITLSPKTNMATQFHLSNGAMHIAENEESNNFEYTL